MGPEDRKPPFPEFPYTAEVPKENVYVTRYEINCNWLQAMEGDYDPSHAMFVHSTLGENKDVARDFSQQGGRLKPDQPVPTTLAVVDTPIGVVRVSPRGLVNGTAAVNAAQIVMPSFPSAGLAQPGVFSSNIRIPIDNEHENHFRLRWTRRGFTEQEIYDYKFGGYAFPLHEPGTYLAKQRKDNDYGYDPVLQRQFNFSGVVPFPTQDLMMIEHQWGAIAKREREHLVASDRIIIHVRRRLLEMAKNLANGIEPEEPFLMKGIRQDATAPVILSTAGRVSPDELDTMLADLNTVKVTKAAPTDEDAEEIWAPSRSEQDDTATSR